MSTFRTITSLSPFDKWRIALNILPFVVVLVAAKIGVVVADADFIELSSLFGSIVAANVFLLGFLLAGTLADYKEAEKLPTQLAGSIEAICDDSLGLIRHRDSAEAKATLRYMAEFSAQVHKWFYREARTTAVMDSITGMTDHFVALEALLPANYIVRLKDEQGRVRQMIGRIDTIRDTTFISAGYAIAELATAILLVGSVFVEMHPWYEAAFYVGIVSFLLLYVIALTGDLDNPFDHGRHEGSVRVSLKPIEDLEVKMQRWVDQMDAGEVPVATPVASAAMG